MNAEAPITAYDLQAYADDELESARRTEVARYLEQNPEAARRVEAIVAQTTIVRAVAAPLLDETIPHHLTMARFFERDWNLGRRFRAAPNVPFHRVAALVAAFVFGAASGWGFYAASDARANRVRPLVEEAADTYAVYEPDRLHAVEIGAAHRDELMDWASSRLRRPISAPETIDNFRLLGGRVVATSRGPAAMFMYDNEHGKRIVMLVCPLSLHGTAPVADSSPDGLSGVSWSEHGIGYSLVGPILGKELHDMGELVRRMAADRA